MNGNTITLVTINYLHCPSPACRCPRPRSPITKQSWKSLHYW